MSEIDTNKVNELKELDTGDDEWLQKLNDMNACATSMDQAKKAIEDNQRIKAEADEKRSVWSNLNGHLGDEQSDKNAEILSIKRRWDNTGESTTTYGGCNLHAKSQANCPTNTVYAGSSSSGCPWHQTKVKCTKGKTYYDAERDRETGPKEAELLAIGTKWRGRNIQCGWHKSNGRYYCGYREGSVLKRPKSGQLSGGYDNIPVTNLKSVTNSEGQISTTGSNVTFNTTTNLTITVACTFCNQFAKVEGINVKDITINQTHSCTTTVNHEIAAAEKEGRAKEAAKKAQEALANLEADEEPDVVIETTETEDNDNDNGVVRSSIQEEENKQERTTTTEKEDSVEAQFGVNMDQTTMIIVGVCGCLCCLLVLGGGGFMMMKGDKSKPEIAKK